MEKEGRRSPGLGFESSSALTSWATLEEFLPGTEPLGHTRLGGLLCEAEIR